MGFRDWLMKKKESIDEKSNQMKAEMLREQMKKQSEKGSMHWAYRNNMSPLEYAKYKKDEYLKKKS